MADRSKFFGLVDMHGNPVEVEPIPDAPPVDSYMQRALAAVSLPAMPHGLSASDYQFVAGDYDGIDVADVAEGDEPCGCDESKALRAELAKYKLLEAALIWLPEVTIRFCDLDDFLEEIREMGWDPNAPTEAED